MFGKKKNNVIKVCHYEGLVDFIQDYPCQISVADDVFTIEKIKPTATVTLPMERIIKFEAMSEIEFMKKYHNCSVEINKIPRNFLVVTYTSKNNTTEYIAFWAAGFEMKKLIDLQYKYIKNSNSYSL